MTPDQVITAAAEQRPFVLVAEPGRWHRRIGERFAERAFPAGGPLAV